MFSCVTHRTHAHTHTLHVFLCHPTHTHTRLSSAPWFLVKDSQTQAQISFPDTCRVIEMYGSPSSSSKAAQLDSVSSGSCGNQEVRLNLDWLKTESSEAQLNEFTKSIMYGWHRGSLTVDFHRGTPAFLRKYIFLKILIRRISKA